ncbi:MAG: hypothetical protein KatS3mg053_1185 [Candidatus Roseilinea sp.]|nr:MAG: hypothetical protein KatS3mg053_1185 [Candidatus Roseilinea sp.]
MPPKKVPPSVQAQSLQLAGLLRQKIAALIGPAQASQWEALAQQEREG